jgi:hypothetical protein
MMDGPGPTGPSWHHGEAAAAAAPPKWGGGANTLAVLIAVLDAVAGRNPF